MTHRFGCLAVCIALAGCNTPPEAATVSITPDAPTTGDDLEAVIVEESFDRNGDAVLYSYTWTVDGVLANADGAQVPAASTAKDQVWEVTVTPTDGKDAGPAATATVSIGNTPPTATVSLSPDAPRTIDDLSATATGEDVDGDTVSFTYSWLRDGVATSNAGATLPASETAKGERWEVRVTPNDGDDDGDIASDVVDIENVAPVVDTVALAPLQPRAGDTLTAAAEGTDLDGDPLTFTYRWEVDGTVQGETGSTLAGAFAKGDTVRVFATANDGFVDSDAVGSNTVEVGNTAPTLTAARLSPTVIFTDTAVSCVSEGFADIDGDTDQTTYSWLVDEKVVGSGPDLAVPIDKGQRVQCIATPFDGEDPGTAVDSDLLRVQNTPPVLSGATLSTTSPREGDTISVTLGSASDADGDTVTYAYAWTVNGSAAGTGSTLSSSDFDKGDSVVCTVTPDDGDDFGTPVVTGTATVANTPPVLSSASLSNTAPRTNDTLSVSATASDVDGDSVTLSYAWRVNGAAISPTTSSIAGTDHFDKDDVVAVTVTPSDGDDTGTASVLSATVENTPPTAPGVAIDPPTPTPSDDLLCEIATASTDDDGDRISYAFSWTRDGTSYTGASTTTYRGDTIESSVTGAGEAWVCTVLPSDDDGPGSIGSDSVDVLGLGEDRDSAVKDCKTLKSLASSEPSGVYWIDPDGDTDHSDAFEAYCDQTTAGGGWTLAWYVDAAHFDGHVANDLVANSSPPTKLNAQKDVWNAESTMSFAETLYGCTTQGDAATYYWRFSSDDPHTWVANTTTDYTYQNTYGSTSTNTTKSNCMAVHKGGSGKSFGFIVLESSTSCGSCNTMLWGMYHYSSGSGCNSTSTTYGSHTSPWRSVTLQYPICGGSQTSNGKFWIGVR